MFKPDAFVNEFNRISSMGKTLLTQNKDITYAAYESFKNTGKATILRRYLPITIRSMRNTPYCGTIDDEYAAVLIREFPEIVNMQQEALKETGYADVPEIRKLKCFENIKRETNAIMMDPEPFLVCCEDIPEAEEEFMDVLEKEAKRAGNKVTRCY